MEDDKLTPDEKRALELTDKANFERLNAFAKEFHTESDRAAVVLGVAKLDELLGELLQRFLLPKTNHPNDGDELLGVVAGVGGGTEKGLSTFSARIHAAYRLGLISKNFRDSINTVRTIRNAFAHRVSPKALIVTPFREPIAKMHRPIPSPTFWNEFSKRHYRDETGPRIDFRTNVAVYAAFLEGALMIVKPVAPQPFLMTV